MPWVTFTLTAYQNENAGSYGKDGQDNSQSAHGDKSGQSCEDKPDGQQQETNIFSDVHENLLSLKVGPLSELQSTRIFLTIAR
jgi:hypothetical protein